MGINAIERDCLKLLMKAVRLIILKLHYSIAIKGSEKAPKQNNTNY